MTHSAVIEELNRVYASTPVAVRREASAAAIDRHRQSVSPAGEISEWVATIELDLPSRSPPCTGS